MRAMWRTSIIIVALCLTAFAPAPLPRRARAEDRYAIDLNSFRGTWAVVSMEIVRAGGPPHTKLNDWGEEVKSGTTGVRVEGNRFTYLGWSGTGGSYRVAIDASRQPARIDWFTDPNERQGEVPGMLGLIRRDGDTVVILYYSTNPERRPTKMEDPPEGWWILTLRRK